MELREIKMSYPLHSPTTAIGSLQSDIHSIQSELRRKADDYKVSSLDSRMDVVVNSIREVSAVCDGILSRLEACEEKIQNLEIQIEALKGDSHD